MRDPDASVEAANRIRHTRREVFNAGSYYIGERSRATGRIFRRPDLGERMLFWQAYGKKQQEFPQNSGALVANPFAFSMLLITRSGIARCGSIGPEASLRY